MIGFNPSCCDCKGSVIFGPALGKTNVTVYDADGQHKKIEYRCEHCMAQHASDLWPDEDFGPCPHVWVRFRGRA